MNEFIKKNIEYCQKTGYINTVLGEKLPGNIERANTVGPNYVVQNFASITLAESFAHMILNSYKVGRPMSPKVVN